MAEIELATEDIENVIDSLPQNFFSSLKTFEVIDKSGYMRTLGIFSSLLKKLVTVEKVSIKTRDRNILIILEESFKKMLHLQDFSLELGRDGFEDLKLTKKSDESDVKLSRKTISEIISSIKTYFSKRTAAA